MIRHDWTLPEVEQLYHTPLMELVYRAAGVHRQYHDPGEIQVCKLISIKTGGCPEDCSYCSQSARYQTEVSASPLMPTQEATGMQLWHAYPNGQPVPNAKNVDYAMIAKGSGYPRAYNFAELDAFSAELPGILKAPGPVFVALKVWPEVENTPIGQRVRWRKRSADRVVRELRDSLTAG